MPLSTESTLTIGLAITLMGAAASFATVWTKVSRSEKDRQDDKIETGKQLDKLEKKIDEQNRKMDRILEILAESGLKKTE